MVLKNIMITIETFHDGGSLSVFKGGVELDFVKFNETHSRSENILQALDGILQKHQLKRENLAKLKLSEGVGSITGNRIGKALALGLKNALGMSVETVSASRMFGEIGDVARRRIFAFPVKKGKLCVLKFEPNESNEEDTRQIAFEDFILNFIGEAERNTEFHITKDLMSKLYETSELSRQNLNFCLLKPNFSFYLS